MNIPNIKPIKPIHSPFLAKKYSLWAYNSNNHLGIIHFAFSMFPDYLNPQYGVADWIPNALKQFLYYKPNMTREDRCHVIATFRGGSKTTWFSFVLVAYFVLLGEYGIYWGNNLLPKCSYIVLKSKTGREAMKRLYNLRLALASSLVTKYFGNINPTIKQIRNKEGKDSNNLLITNTRKIIEAIGINQPIRGANILGNRPNGIIYDDPEHLENTKTPERREANQKDLLEESFGALDDYGFLVYIGNKVHEDDTIGKLLVNPMWKKQFYTLTYTKDGKEVSAWEKKFPLERIEKIKKFYESHPKLGLRTFMKNFYNKIISDVDFKIKYYNAQYKYENGVNWLIFPDGKRVNVYITIACDPAISDKKSSCNSSIGAVAIDTNGNRYVLEISNGKYDIHDRYYDDFEPIHPLAITKEDIAKIKRRGSCEEIIRLFLRYNANSIVIETAGQQRGFYNEVLNLLEKLGKRCPVLDSVPNQEKISKLREGVLIYFEAGLYYIKEDMYNLIQSINTFPYSSLDDLDMLYLAELMLAHNKPQKLNYSIFNKTYSYSTSNVTIDTEIESWVYL